MRSSPSRRARPLRALAAFVLAAALLPGGGLLAASPAGAATPAATATPSTGLADGQTVTITGSGFASDAQIGLAQGISEAFETDNTTLRVPGPIVGADGTFTTEIVVKRLITISGTQRSADCAEPGRCAIWVANINDFAQQVAIPIQLSSGPDTTPPTVTITSPADGATYSVGQSVSAEYTCADIGGSVLASCSGSEEQGTPVDTASEGTKMISVTALDGAGNETTVTHTYVVAPAPPPPPPPPASTATATATPSTGLVDGQTVTITASGYSPRANVALVQGLTASHQGGANFESDNSTLNFPGTIGDGGGGFSTPFVVKRFITTASGTYDCAEPGRCSVFVGNFNALDTEVVPASVEFTAGPDATPPTVDLRTPGNGAAYSAGSRVVADYSCTDIGGSSVASCEGTVADGARIDTAAEGAKTFSVVATDGAGNETTVEHSYTVSAATGPRVTVDPSGGLQDGQQVTVSGTGYEPGGDVGLAQAPVATLIRPNFEVDNILISPANADGTFVQSNYTVKRFISVGSGLYDCAVPDTCVIVAPQLNRLGEEFPQAPITVAGGVSPDITAPTIDITSPADGQVYEPGEAVFAEYGCADESGGSGIASCEGTVPSGDLVDTSTPGPATFTATATDAAGNVAEQTVEYRVAGAYQPTTTSMWALPNPSYGRPVTLQVRVDASGDRPTGTVTFKDGDVVLGQADLEQNLTATLRIGVPSTGVHDYTAEYAGAPDRYLPSAATLTFDTGPTDFAAPQLSLAAPVPGSILTVGQEVRADYACEEEVGGSGLVECYLATYSDRNTFADLRQVADGAPVDTSTPGVRYFTLVSLDQAGNRSITSLGDDSYTVVEAVNEAAGPVDPGGSVSTHPSGGQTSTDPLGTTVTSPTGGQVSVAEAPATTPPPAGYGFLGQAVAIEAPPGTAAEPLALTFDVDASLLPEGEDAGSVQVFRNGVAVAPCTGPAGVAEPDPCVSAREATGGGDLRLTVLSSRASLWNLGVVTDRTDPTVTVTSPADGATFTKGQAVTPAYACADETGGSGVVSCQASALDTSSIGSKVFSVTARDAVGNETTVVRSYRVVYAFRGFLEPVDAEPTRNRMKAGKAVPVRFSLGGNQGTAVLASGSPSSAAVPCAAGSRIDDVEVTVNASRSAFTYVPVVKEYVYLWATDKAWAGTCRRLTITLTDGTTHTATFQLTR